MAVDKFTAVPTPEDDGKSTPPEDAWKDKEVQREHTPAKVKSNLTYRQVEKQIDDIDRFIATQQEKKAKLEADLAKIQEVAKPSE